MRHCGRKEFDTRIPTYSFKSPHSAVKILDPDQLKGLISSLASKHQDAGPINSHGIKALHVRARVAASPNHHSSSVSVLKPQENRAKSSRALVDM